MNAELAGSPPAPRWPMPSRRTSVYLSWAPDREGLLYQHGYAYSNSRLLYRFPLSPHSNESPEARRDDQGRPVISRQTYGKSTATDMPVP